MEFIPSSGSENFLKGQWKNLIFLNYAVPPESLMDFLPEKCELDLFAGKAYVSLVAQQFLNLNVMGVSVPGFHNFPQIHLRTYVQYEGQRGVRLLKEFLPSRLAALAARMIYHEQCESAAMESHLSVTPQKARAQYDLENANGHLQIRVRAANLPSETEPTSPESFFHFRNLGVSAGMLGQTFSYQIYSPPWRHYPVEEFQTSGDFSKIFGERFAVLEEKPESVFYFEGSDIALSGARYPEAETVGYPTSPEPSLTI